jgi:peroxiredoxin
MGLLQKGEMAPGFTLPSAPDKRLSLSEFRGKNVVLVFYPADWSPVCSDELVVFSEIIPMLRNYNAEVLGISVDGPWCHQAYGQDRKLRFPLLADFQPKGEVSLKYGAYRSREGTSERALFVIDGEGRIRWSFLSPLDVNPGAEGVIDTLESLTAAEVAR